MPKPADAERRQRQIAAEIAKLGLCLPGSLVDRMTRCGSPRCRCHSDPSRLHGPYPSWIRKAGAKTVTRTLTPAQAERYRPLIENTKRLRELISELETLSAQVVEEAEGWVQPADTCGEHTSYSEDTTTDNVSSPKPRTRGDYSEDTQIRG
ncbi:MAG TPA: DUF6788 family protein [Streptosporangiaceae bacterium]